VARFPWHRNRTPLHQPSSSSGAQIIEFFRPPDSLLKAFTLQPAGLPFSGLFFSFPFFVRRGFPPLPPPQILFAFLSEKTWFSCGPTSSSPQIRRTFPSLRFFSFFPECCGAFVKPSRFSFRSFSHIMHAGLCSIWTAPKMNALDWNALRSLGDLSPHPSPKTFFHLLCIFLVPGFLLTAASASTPRPGRWRSRCFSSWLYIVSLSIPLPASAGLRCAYILALRRGRAA